MKLLASITYGKNISEYILRSLVDSARVNQVYVVSDLDVPQISRVEVYRTPRWLSSPFHKVTLRGILRVASRFMLMLYLTLTKRPDIIVGFNIFPQTICAFTCARLSRKPAIVCIGDWPGIWRARRKLLPILKRCDAITTTGSKSREYLIRQGIKANRIFALHRSKDTERFHPIPMPKKYDLLFMGRLAPAKNLETLLRVVSEVRALKRDLRVAIVGDGYLRDSLEQMAIQLGITDNLEFPGASDKPEYYYNCSKILMLTSHYEGMPNVMLEAMACGVPCVVPDVGDITDAAIDGVNAIVIREPYDIPGFTSAIIKLLDDKEFYNRLSQNTRKVVMDRYSLKNATDTWDKIFASLER